MENYWYDRYVDSLQRAEQATSIQSHEVYLDLALHYVSMWKCCPRSEAEPNYAVVP